MMLNFPTEYRKRNARIVVSDKMGTQRTHQTNGYSATCQDDRKGVYVWLQIYPRYFGKYGLAILDQVRQAGTY